MIRVEIPGYGDVEIKHVLFDYNGTLAVGGYVAAGVREMLGQLATLVDIYVITADTFGSVQAELTGEPLKVIRISGKDERAEKLAFVQQIGSQQTLSIGNGNNDALMLRESAIGIAIMGREGCAKSALDNADLLVGDILCALEMLICPERLKATLRY
jgi:soluble P-type ATPase